MSEQKSAEITERRNGLFRVGGGIVGLGLLASVFLYILAIRDRARSMRRGSAVALRPSQM